MRLRVCKRTCDAFKLLLERLIIEEYPWIIELAIERLLEFPHTLRHLSQLTVPHQRNYRGLSPRKIRLLGIYQCLVLWRRKVLVVVFDCLCQVVFPAVYKQCEQVQCRACRGENDEHNEGEAARRAQWAAPLPPAGNVFRLRLFTSPTRSC